MRYLLALLALGAAALTAYAQTDHNQHRAGAGAVAEPGAGHMMKMPDEMKQRCRMMMQTAINPADPAAILGLKDDLKFTPEQVRKLQAIADKARQEAKAVLDEKQAKILESVPAKPETSAAMHQHMMQMMHKMRDGQGGHAGHAEQRDDGGGGQMPMMNCPMMNMMNGAATQPAQGKPAAGHETDH